MKVDIKPEIFGNFNDKIGRYFRLPPTLRSILDEFVNIDVNAEEVAKIVQRNQYFEAALMHQIRNMGLRSENFTLRHSVSMLGMQRFRDLACSMQVYRLIEKKHFPIPKSETDENNEKKEQDIKDGQKKEEEPEFNADTWLKYALKTEEYVSARRLKYADTAYAAGVMFDLVSAIGTRYFKADKAFDDYVAEVYKHSLKTAMIGVEIAKTLKGFSFTKYTFGACLIHDIGKLVMELLLQPNYTKFRENISKLPTSRFVRHFRETQTFGFSHEYFSAQLTYLFGVFRGIEKAILFHHEPFLIKSNKDFFTFSALIALSSNVASNFFIPKDTKDPIYDAWFTPELKNFTVDPKTMLLIMQKIGRDTY